jgi:phosphate transport system protein
MWTTCLPRGLYGKVLPMDELRKGFHHQLDEIREEVARLAAMVIEAVPRATAILLAGDLAGAETLIAADDEIDARSIDIEERCYQVLALQAPVAGDLRQVVAVLKMVAEIERSADLTVNICKAARRIYRHELDPRLRGLLQQMGEQAQQLFAAALESFEESDPVKAAALDDMDGFLDGLQKEMVQAILVAHASGKIDIQVGIQLAVVARFYERIGDHAVNIGERVRYLVTGWLPEHKGAARFLSKQRDDTDGIPFIESTK